MPEVKIKVSKFQTGVTGVDDCFEEGDKAIYTATTDGSKHLVIIDSELSRHLEAPGGGLVYECLLNGELAAKFGLTRCALSAYQLTPHLAAEDFAISPEYQEYINNRCMGKKTNPIIGN